MSFQVLVVGATGGVGQLAAAKLLEKGFLVRVLVRSSEKARQMFGNSLSGDLLSPSAIQAKKLASRLEVAVGDIRQPETLPPAMQDIDYIICCTGTTAFPSARWEFDIPQPLNGLQSFKKWIKIYLNSEYRHAKAKNSPNQVDTEGIRHLVAVALRSLKRFVLISSCGIERKDNPPYNLLNAFGILDAKQQGEEALKQSGLPYTIIRPGRLIDGPYTSYDLNTLLKATTKGKLGIVIGTGDKLSGQTSRIDVAAAWVECLNNPVTEGKTFEIVNQGKRSPSLDWTELFAQLA